MTVPSVPPWAAGDDAVAEAVAAGLVGEHEAADRWHIDGERSAEWAMARLAAAEAEIAAVDAAYADWRAELDAWRASAVRAASRTAEFFGEHLRRWAIARRQATGHATVVLPSGRVSTRAAGPRLAIADEPALLAWLDATTVRLDDDADPAYCSEEPLAERVVRVTRKVLVSELADYVTIVVPPDDGEPFVVYEPTGEVVPGVTVARGSVSASVAPTVPALPSPTAYTKELP